MSNKKERTIIIITALILIALLVFSLFNWSTISYLFKQISSGAGIVKEYVLSLGVTGVIAMSIVIIVCFFFPFISSVPIQLASAVSYGLLWGVVHVTLSIFVASQLAFLFTKSTLFLSSKKKKEEHRLMEEKIKNSNRSIYYFLFLAYLAPFVPFLIIHMVAADSGMKWWKYAIVTLLGPIPDIVITLWAGVKITTSSSPITSYVILMVIIAIVVLSMVYKKKLVDLIFTPKEKNKDE
ncbi:MAG: TVP38/TMEM64 family protein [Clostridiales bacterium]|nr:TVP38/TMEM64 family protein [Clostridiales bacterium]